MSLTEVPLDHSLPSSVGLKLVWSKSRPRSNSNEDRHDPLIEFSKTMVLLTIGISKVLYAFDSRFQLDSKLMKQDVVQTDLGRCYSKITTYTQMDANSFKNNIKTMPSHCRG